MQLKPTRQPSASIVSSEWNRTEQIRTEEVDLVVCNTVTQGSRTSCTRDSGKELGYYGKDQFYRV